MSTIQTLAEVAAKASGFTVKDGLGGFFLYIGLYIGRITENLIGTVPDIPDISHGSALRSDQKD